MAEQRQDRRVRRSKAQLRQALIQLLQEKAGGGDHCPGAD